jgi:hypothetical protein
VAGLHVVAVAVEIVAAAVQETEDAVIPEDPEDVNNEQ